MGLKPFEINLISIEYYAICQFVAAVVKFFPLTFWGISSVSPALCCEPVWHIYRRFFAVVHIYIYLYRYIHTVYIE
jgi:hypothetical protein